jgi:lysozyme
VATSPYLIPDLEAQEGVRLKPYRDSRGVWTIGVGHDLQVDPTLYPQLAHLIVVGITQAQCDSLLAADIGHVTSQFGVLIPWWQTLAPLRADVLVNIAFNVGVGEFMTWHHTLDYAQAGLWISCGDEIEATEPWASQVGARAQILGAQMRTGMHA